MKIRPLHDRVIVKRLEEDRTTASGIVIPESVEGEKPDQGTIQAIGNGKILEVFRKVKVKNHAQLVLERVQEILNSN